MPETKTITLLVPIEHHGATLASLELREPSGALYAQLGDPRIVVQTKDGGYYVEQTEVVKRYLDKLIVHQDGSVLLTLMSMPDVMRLKQELFSFFTVAETTIIALRAGSSSSA